MNDLYHSFPRQRILLFLVFVGLVTVTTAAQAGRLSYPLKSLSTQVAQANQNGSTVAVKPYYAPTKPHLRRRHAMLEVQVQVRYQPSQAPTKAMLAMLAFTTMSALPKLNLLEGWLPIANLEALSKLTGIQIVKLPDYGIAQRIITSQGDAVIEANKARAAGLTGRGVTVGVISDGIVGIQSVQDADELPADIQMIGNDQGKGHEGVAVLEIIHDIAPDAKLAFCKIEDKAQLLQCVKHFKQSGADIVVSDVGTFDNPFASSYLAQIQALANQKDLLWIQAGGNDGQNTVNAPFVPVNFVLGSGQSVSAMDFGKAAGEASMPYDTVTVPAGDDLTFSIWWDDDPGAKHPNNIYGIYLLDQNNNVLASKLPAAGDLSKPQLAGIFNNKSGQAQSVRLVFAHTQGSGHNRIAFYAADLTNGTVHGAPLAISTPTSIGAMSAAKSVLSVGAVNVATPNTIEPFSSEGPTYVEWLYDAETAQYRKAEPSIQCIKPDLVAPDRVSVLDVDGDAASFSGTSAAAPHVAGAAALLESYRLSKAEVVTALEKSAIDLGKSGKDNVYGYGRIDAYKALETADIPPNVSITAPNKNVTIDVGKSVTFKGDCASNEHKISTYAWDFANGQTSSQKDPGAITFKKAGSYKVTLTCTDSTGIKNPDPATRTVTIQGQSSPPKPTPKPDPNHGGGGGFFGPLDLLGLLLLGVPALIRRSRH